LGNKKPYFSICIPTYSYNGKGCDFLEHSFNKIYEQTFKDYEIVISDHSIDNSIKNVCDKWSDKLPIVYILNDKGRGIISPNLNVCLQKSTGKWIKILFQDDFLYDDKSLEITYDYIIKNPTCKWIASYTYVTSDGINIERSFQPRWVDNIWSGNNTIGSPTNITMLNDDVILFDVNLNWLMDVDYYMKMKNKFGDINILDRYTIVNRTSPERLSNNITEKDKNIEIQILKNIYDKS
jgi:hypothetical protein